MSSQLQAVTFDVPDPARPAAFWGALLERPVLSDPRGALLPGSDTQVGLRFAAGEPADSGTRPLHLHVTSDGVTGQQETVDRALALGAQHLDLGQRPEEGHIVLADPAGTPFCVIEPGNTFLAGCGVLGEVACEGTRQVGQFWSQVLGWPLVWDRDGETAVQSPLGGTKLAWGGPPVPPKERPNPQRFDLVVAADTLSTEVSRLVTLGAARSGTNGDAVELTDPDGNEFRLLPG